MTRLAGLGRHVARFGADARGVAAIEMALVAPVLILLLVTGADTARFVSATRKVTQIADTIATITSENTTGSVTSANLRFYSDSAMVVFPQLLQDGKTHGNDWTNNVSITVSSVKFVQVAGISQGLVSWTAGDVRRPCLVPMISILDTQIPTPLTLPQSVLNSNVSSVIVADVSYHFTPLIGSSLLGTLTISRSFYLAPRYVPSIAFDSSAGSESATACPLG